MLFNVIHRMTSDEPDDHLINIIGLPSNRPFVIYSKCALLFDRNCIPPSVMVCVDGG